MKSSLLTSDNTVCHACVFHTVSKHNIVLLISVARAFVYSDFALILHCFIRQTLFSSINFEHELIDKAADIDLENAPNSSIHPIF